MEKKYGPLIGDWEADWDAMGPAMTVMALHAGSPRHAREPHAGLPEDGPAIPEPGSGSDVAHVLLILLVTFCCFLSEKSEGPKVLDVFGCFWMVEVC